MVVYSHTGILYIIFAFSVSHTHTLTHTQHTKRKNVDTAFPGVTFLTWSIDLVNHLGQPSPCISEPFKAGKLSFVPHQLCDNLKVG